MRRTGMLGLCIVAVFATAAFATATASASPPEWGQCYQVKPEGQGHYADSACTRKARHNEGEYEWRKGTAISSKQFVSAGGPAVLAAEYVICSPPARTPSCSGGSSSVSVAVECPTEIDKGFIAVLANNELRKVEVTFKGCQLLGTPCENDSNASGEVTFNSLHGKLQYISGPGSASPIVGIVLEPESAAPAPRPFVTFECPTLGDSFVVGLAKVSEGCAYTTSPPTYCGHDGVISPVTPVDVMSTAFTQIYTETLYENIPNHVVTAGNVAKPLRELESYIFNTSLPSETSKWAKTGLTLTNVLTAQPISTEWEIKT